MKVKSRSIKGGVILLGGVVLLLAGCGKQDQGKAATQNKTLNVMLPSEPMTADPNKSTDTNSSSMIRQVMEGLYAFDQNNQKIVPGVATKVVKPTNDGKRYTIPLKHDAKWADGTPVTAQDFVYAFRRIADPKTNAQNVSAYENVQNFTAVQSGKLPGSRLGIKALDKHTVQINLARKTPWFNYLAAIAFYPLQKATVEKYGSKYGTSSAKVMTNGAYRLKNWNGTSTSWNYVKDPNYWGAKKVKIKNIKVKVTKEQNTAVNLFKTNKLQEATLTGQYVKGNANNPQMRKHLLNRMNYLYFNAKDQSVASEDLRQAFSYVINRKTITKNVLGDGSEPALSMIPRGNQKEPVTGKDMAAEIGNLVPTDVKQAKVYWNKYLKEQGKKNVTLDLMIDDTDEDKHIGDYIQSVAEKDFKGLNVTVTSLPHAQHINREFANKFQISLLGWTSDWGDAADFLNLAAGGNTVNFSNWTDQKYDSDLTKAQQTDGQARYQALKSADQRLMEVKGVVPLYQPAEGKLAAKGVGGLKYSLFNGAQYKNAYWK
ncbi:oligopeptide ABC transporter substrate-binding protein [Ligilactobacillus salitolerans]|uniref:Oligopeptide ABC transporter substrate-binding protein n=1 Tax=Ligilactobacillus salitolerans TaxID=1808352 RepID=A0A401IQG5_9LACO|nr:peptide ABC transporter substrate-binding protein [Ligilactobacillus salitolerans]GBG93760.1 oligopeptide ABC transporter substrate-binding protein [Ligilactobacillus salitolerans]